MIKIDTESDHYEFIIKNRWIYLFTASIFIVFIHNFYDFSVGVILTSFLSGFFGFFAAFKTKIGKIECEKFFSVLFIMFAFGPAVYVGKISKIEIHLNIFTGILLSITILSFVFKNFRHR